jgi:hypothetical protein
MATIPLLSRLGGRLAPRLAPKMPVDPSILVPQVSDTLPRVIVAGFCRVGQTVGAMLEVHKVPYVAIDRDADRVAHQRGQGAPAASCDSRPSSIRPNCLWLQSGRVNGLQQENASRVASGRGTHYHRPCTCLMSQNPPESHSMSYLLCALST